MSLSMIAFITERRKKNVELIDEFRFEMKCERVLGTIINSVHAFWLLIAFVYDLVSGWELGLSL